MPRSIFAFASLSVPLALGACATGMNNPPAPSELVIIQASPSTTTSSAGGSGGSGGSAEAGPVTVATTGVATSAIATGGGTCDASNDCNTCGNCALGGICAGTMSACQADQNCTALLSCLDTCADPTCANTCASQYPGGMSLYESLITCVVCDSCSVSCNGAAMGC